MVCRCGLLVMVILVIWVCGVWMVMVCWVLLFFICSGSVLVILFWISMLFIGVVRLVLSMVCVVFMLGWLVNGIFFCGLNMWML